MPAEDYYLQPGTRLLTQAELQGIQSRKRKKRKDCLVDACVVDMDKTYAFVPKPGAAYSTHGGKCYDYCAATA
jgi:hypothetical protein